MMRRSRSLIIALLALCAVSASAQKKTFTAWIIQDDKRVEVNDNEVILEKKPFVIELVLNNIEGVSVNSSFDRTYFDPAGSGEVYDLVNISARTMSEDNFNKEKELLISTDGVCYWFYDPELDWHRMDSVVVVNGNIVTCHKTIEKIDDTDAHREYAVADITKDLYLVFASTKQNRDFETTKVYDVSRVKIVWGR